MRRAGAKFEIKKIALSKSTCQPYLNHTSRTEV